MKTDKQLKRIRRWAWIFIILLGLSGLTAIPVQWELDVFFPLVSYLPLVMQQWYNSIAAAIQLNQTQYPFVLYAFDWLGFAHIIIGVFMFGLIKDPIRNQWLIQAALIACLLIFPFAFIMGAIRGIPFWWRLIDCSFGVFGIIPLMVVQKKIKALEQTRDKNADQHISKIHS